SSHAANLSGGRAWSRIPTQRSSTGAASDRWSRATEVSSTTCHARNDTPARGAVLKPRGAGPGHNYPSYMSDMYHPHNAQAPMPTPMVPSRSGAPTWPHMPLQQHEFMMTANPMEDKVTFGLRGVVGIAWRSRALRDRSLGDIYR